VVAFTRCTGQVPHTLGISTIANSNPRRANGTPPDVLFGWSHCADPDATTYGGEVKRREFITLLGAAAATWPLTARAQQPAMPVVGFLDRGSSQGMTANLAAFARGLGEAGYTEGKNVAIDYRWAESRYEQLPALAAELVRQHVDVIAATRTSAPAIAAKAATSSIPIVFQTGGDPVKDGLVAALNRPGGNVTGVTRLSNELTQKRFGLISELVPNATTIALLESVGAALEGVVQEMQEVARKRGVKLQTVHVSAEAELDTAFAALAQAHVDALINAGGPLTVTRRDQIIALTMRYAIPTIFFDRESVLAGGLMSYAASFSDSFRQVGVYVGRILKGAKPGDLPVVQPTKFELVINLKTAKTLGLTIPPGVLAIADEVIE
jgi:putative tryptophan/tyrosine transport system substrate-binding protein